MVKRELLHRLYFLPWFSNGRLINGDHLWCCLEDKSLATLVIDSIWTIIPPFLLNTISFLSPLFLFCFCSCFFFFGILLFFQLNLFLTTLFTLICRRFGTWPVAMLSQSKNKVILEGPICNGTEVIGWHSDQIKKISKRFSLDISGFAFNSTILWDPKRWRRPTIEPIRLYDTIKGLLVSSLSGIHDTFDGQLPFYFLWKTLVECNTSCINTC